MTLTCRKWNNPHDPTDNRPPTTPSHPRPDSSATGRDTGLALCWQSQDPDSGDTVYFDIFFGKTSPPGLAQDSWTDTTFHPTNVTYTTQYYWRVIAYDNHGDSSVGSLWKFATGAANRVPHALNSPNPGDGATGLMLHTSLSWKGGDPDTADTVTYDVYFGTSDSPPCVAQAQRDSSYTPADLKYDSLYYWKVVATDNHGAQTPGPRWQFSTATSVVVTAPAAGDRLRLFTTDTITWTGGPGDRPALLRGSKSRGKVQKARVKTTGIGRGTAGVLAAADSTVVYRSTDDGASWLRLGLASLAGQFVWSVDTPTTKLARVRVRAFASGDTMTGTSGKFEVYDTARPSPIVVTSPDSASQWAIGTAQIVTWTGGTDGVDSTVVYYSSNSGMTWSRQGAADPGTPGVFPWAVPGPATALAKVEVRAYNISGVTTGSSRTFTIIEPPYPDSVIAIVSAGSRPAALCYDSADNRVYVALYKDTGSVSVIDGNTNGVTARIAVGRYPCALVWNPAMKKVYVANQLDDSVSVIYTASNQVGTTVAVGAKPYALCLNPVNNKVYVANYNDSSVSVIDGATNTVITTVAVGRSPQALYWNPANNVVYVANFGANSVSLIDGATNQLITTPNTDVGPCALAAESTYEEVYVADRTVGKVTIMDFAGQVVTSFAVGQEPWAVAASPVNDRVYTANSGDNTVTVIDGTNHGIVTHVSVSAQPRTLWWAPQVGKLYVACYAGGSVAIIDGSTNQLLRTVAVGNKPSALCWNSQGSKVYVANYDDGTVSVLGARLKERP